MPSDLVGRLLILAGLCSHEYNLKTKVSSDSSKYKHQHIWAKAIWGHTGRAANLVSIPGWTKDKVYSQEGYSMFQMGTYFHGFLPWSAWQSQPEGKTPEHN